MKKTLFVVLALLITGLPLFARGGGQGSGGGQSSGGGSAAAANSLTVAAFENWYSAVPITDKLPVMQAYEKITGIHVTWQCYPDVDVALQPVIAAGGKLPDIMVIPPAWGSSGVYKLGQDKVILQLDDLIAKYAPNVQKAFAGNPALKAGLVAPDGKLYSFANTSFDVDDYVVPNSLIIRKDWLDKLGLSVPVTIDDWHRVLVAFRDNDPNGNGKKDEIPFGGFDSIYAYLHAFGPAFGLLTTYSEWWYDNSGRVYHEASSAKYREFIRVMAQWYKEGLIDTEINRDFESFQSLASTNIVGAFPALDAYVAMFNGVLKNAGVSDVNYILVVPPKTPDGSNPLVAKRNPFWSHFGITKDAKSPEIAMKWLDIIWPTEEIWAIDAWGIEGKSFTRDASGQRHYTDFILKNPDGLDSYNALRSLGAGNGHFLGGYYSDASQYRALNSGTPAVLEHSEKVKNFRILPFPAGMLSDAEFNIVSRYGPDLATYQNETITKMIIGDIPMSDWDNYVRTLNSLGIAEIQKVRQAQYDRGK
jgi:putative aldouronate transport system substrate-binding protein